MLPGQRPYRELHWLSRMPGAGITAVGEPRPPEDVEFVARPYRQPTTRFVEAGALAWLRGLDSLPETPGWLASLELCSLVTGQVSALARRRGQRQAVLVWANDPATPLYRLPPYRQALRRARSADLFLCFVEAARQHCLALGLEAERCAVVLPGVDTELFHPAAEPVAEPVALFVSPLAANKGIDRVLEAHRLVRRQLPEARLEVLGRGRAPPAVPPGAAAAPAGGPPVPGRSPCWRRAARRTARPAPPRARRPGGTARCRRRAAPPRSAPPPARAPGSAGAPPPRSTGTGRRSGPAAAPAGRAAAGTAGWRGRWPTPAPPGAGRGAAPVRSPARSPASTAPARPATRASPAASRARAARRARRPPRIAWSAGGTDGRRTPRPRADAARRRR